MCSIKISLISLLVFCAIAQAEVTGAAQTDSTMTVDSAVSAASLTFDSLQRDSGLSATAKRSNDTSAATVDSAAGGPSDGERMYRSVIPVMRRDEPIVKKAADTSARPRQEKLPEPMLAPPPKPPAVDSFLVLPGAQHQASSGPKTRLQKRSVFIVLGACAVVGGAVALYLIKNSQNKSAMDINSRIPPPPEPPVGGISP